MSTCTNSPLAVYCSKLFNFIDSITLNNLLQTDLCDWGSIFSNKQLLSKYLQQDEMRNRMNSFRLKWKSAKPELYLHYLLNIDVLNANVNSEIDIA